VSDLFTPIVLHQTETSGLRHAVGEGSTAFDDF
jgi:hypothetical protein